MGRKLEASVLEEHALKCRARFEETLKRLSEPGSNKALDETERGLFGDVIQMGRLLLELHLKAKGDGNVGPEAVGPGGKKPTVARARERAIPIRLRRSRD